MLLRRLWLGFEPQSRQRHPRRLTARDGPTSAIPLSHLPAPSATVPPATLPARPARTHRSKPILLRPAFEFATSLSAEPIDAVYTWVNGTDAAWVVGHDRFAVAAGRNTSSVNKFRDWLELLYSLRSIRAHMPWLRHVFLVTAGQMPSWLADDVAGLTVVYHDELFEDPESQLPTYNSLAIESVLHRIPGLSNYFLYFNNGTRCPSPCRERKCRGASLIGFFCLVMKQTFSWGSRRNFPRF